MAFGALAMAVVGGLIFRGEYETQQTATRTFTIDQDFTKVRKILVRFDGAKKLVEMGGDTYLEQKWSDVDAKLGAENLLNPDWHLELDGVLKVQTHDAYVGDQDLDLTQKVVITVDMLHSDVKMKEPAGRLHNYALITNFDRQEPESAKPPETGGAVELATAGTTKVELKLTEKILTDPPWFAHGIADRRVKASVEKRLEHQEEAIRKFIADHIDEVPMFPLR
jgi:hypothetical protein